MTNARKQSYPDLPSGSRIQDVAKLVDPRVTALLERYYQHFASPELPVPVDSIAVDLLGLTVDEFERIESNLDFDRLLADLPGRERQVAALRWQHGLEVPQIAEILGIETNAVHQALFRAHRKLSEKLG